MAVTLVTTVSGTSSNAYADSTFYDSYFEPVLSFTGVWAGFTTEQKNARIAEATRALDRSFEWVGKKTVSTQALQFPRDISSTEYPSTLISPLVKSAVGELIIYLYNTVSSTGELKFKEEKIVKAVNGLVEVEYFSNGKPAFIDVLAGGSTNSIMSLLKPWMGYSSVKLTR